MILIKMDGQLNEIRDSLLKESLEYVKSHITSNDITTQVIAGIAFRDGAEYVLEKLKDK